MKLSASSESPAAGIVSLIPPFNSSAEVAGTARAAADRKARLEIEGSIAKDYHDL